MAKEKAKKKDVRKKGDPMSKEVYKKGESGITIIRSGIETRLDDIDNEQEEDQE